MVVEKFYFTGCLTLEFTLNFFSFSVISESSYSCKNVSYIKYSAIGDYINIIQLISLKEPSLGSNLIPEKHIIKIIICVEFRLQMIFGFWVMSS